jgi:hypothetical protein
MNCSVKKLQTSLLAIALLAAGAISATAAVAPPAPSRIYLRGLNPHEISQYGLTGLQVAGGISTVGLGQPAHVEAQIPLSIAASNVTSVVFALTEKPLGSAAVLEASPLTANVPMGEPSDRLTYWLGARSMLKPDVEGAYKVSLTVMTTTATNSYMRILTGGRFLGWDQGCIACHSGGLISQNMTGWTNTGHAVAFKDRIDESGGHFNANCLGCHTVGYDLNTNAVNGGFDDVAKQINWQFPPVLTNGNWAAMPAALKNVANVQCENCHGPGSKHLVTDGILGNTNAISISFDSALCGQCHDAPNYHVKHPEWLNSRHAIVTSYPSGPGRESCVICHSAPAFIEKTKGKTNAFRVDFEPIGCAACHDPHSGENPNQLRKVGEITLMDGFTVVEEAGKGGLCMSCHLSRRNATNYVETTTGSSLFGPHHSNQADMLVGANAITYGKLIGSSAHGRAVENTCVGCHMQAVTSSQPGYLAVGGHTFKLGLETSTNKIEIVKACTECHGEVESFDLVRQDYNGDGVVEGIQSEVKSLLKKLAKMLPPVGVDKETISINSSWTKQQLKAGYNWRFVGEEGSYGIHNPAYAVGLLKASIADITGDSNEDGLPDAWQIQYFGDANAANAAPNATPAGDGVPNWLKWSLGLDPMVPGIQVPGGVVWANASAMGGSTNTIQIFTAAEVAFNTEVGKTHQLESISTLGGGWVKVGAPIPGNGKAYSFVTPTRSNTQQFFRVMTTTP